MVVNLCRPLDEARLRTGINREHQLKGVLSPRNPNENPQELLSPPRPIEAQSTCGLRKTKQRAASQFNQPSAESPTKQPLAEGEQARRCKNHRDFQSRYRSTVVRGLMNKQLHWTVHS
jgi:hypothetical protein